ncbi:LA2681 family HEPN domain-containing protein [Lelliottia amnigena]|nr:LA2681 family HEPN domain-containing protein [Lelliottia amnigena]
MNEQAQTILLDDSAIALFEMRADEVISSNLINKIIGFIKAIENPNYVFSNEIIKSRYYYTIANCQSAAFIKTNTNWHSEELGKSVINYRKALNALQHIENTDKYIINLKSRIETNLGNYLCSQGRVLCCKNHWEMAIALDNNPVAIIRKAYNNLNLAGLLYDEGHSYYHYYEAYKSIKEGLKELDTLDPELSSAYNENGDLIKFKNWFESNFEESDFHLIESYKEKFESKAHFSYLKWCGDNRLFLNELNDEYKTELVFTDSITLPSHTTIMNQTLTMSEDLTYHGNFDEIKNDYIYARYLIFIAHNIPNDKNHFFNTTYQHTDDMSHAITNLKAQHYKSAFKTLYAIFDKIAYFLNSFYDYNDVDAKIYFHNFFGKFENGRLKPHSKLKESNNQFLHALFYILKDIRDSNHKDNSFDSESYWLDPDAEQFSKIRNAIEHKSLKIIDEFGYKLLKTETDFYEKALTEEKNNLTHLESEIYVICKEIKIYKDNHHQENLKELIEQRDKLSRKITLSKIKINEKTKRAKHSLMICETDFESRLTLLMKLVRRSIIYLSLAIHWEQQKSKDNNTVLISREVPLKK